MRNWRTLMLLGATFALAATTGHVMQTVQAPNAPRQHALKVQNIVQTSAVFRSGTDVFQTYATDFPVLPQRVAANDIGVPALTHSEVIGGFMQGDEGCDAPLFTLTADAQAMVSIGVIAPCYADQSAQVDVAGLRLDVALDSSGLWIGQVPAMAREIDASLILADATYLGTIQVPQLQNWNRLGVISQGRDGLRLNAFEHGAAWGAAGHLSAASMQEAQAQSGGFMTILQTADGHAQIYSAPVELTDVRLELDADVTAQTCDQRLTADVIRANSAVQGPPLQLRLEMPDCDEVGGSVVLPLDPFSTQLARLQ
ncbi:hypothetical protein BFP70_18090 [Thioclava sp. SK-1]|uniref:hypothetical protein n=1 Tax=Thioclava sp. SK-1 TaxID=1889770 RepID=UPI000825566E|nr:hypothetical protein [Thioclava sp. SK-1]OCX59833.1 hypothetical protein BFP70_18090 [Thioclava sp. SK-1]